MINWFLDHGSKPVPWGTIFLLTNGAKASGYPHGKKMNFASYPI